VQFYGYGQMLGNWRDAFKSHQKLDQTDIELAKISEIKRNHKNSNNGKGMKDEGNLPSLYSTES
jgi:hypothetical protein